MNSSKRRYAHLGLVLSGIATLAAIGLYFVLELAVADQARIWLWLGWLCLLCWIPIGCASS